MDRHPMAEALEIQEVGSARLGSPFYEELLHTLRLDFEAGGPVHSLLADTSDRPVHDALPLRLLGAVHRIVLRGDAPRLAARYPSAGGDGIPVALDEFMAVVDAHRAEVERALGEQVQTNEVGRAAALVLGFARVSRRWNLPLRVLEMGASAGLNLRWDRFAYDTGHLVAGQADSPVRFSGVWSSPPDLSGLTEVVERRGCDIAPIDPADPEQRLRLLSFVWPDQTQRFELLSRALDVSNDFPVDIDCADAATWLAERLREGRPGIATVVYHSIVWQYFGRETRDGVRAALSEAGSTATADAPVHWLRLEPAGAHADLRLTTWPGGEEELLATSGYHGADITPS